MSRFANSPTLPRPGRGVIQGTPARTFEGGRGYTATDPHNELFNYAVSGFLADGYYQKAAIQLARVQELVGHCDPAWLRQFVPWLRNEAGMRTMSIVIAAEYARHGWPGSRQIIADSISRADEPGELLAYWKAYVSPTIPSRVKRGVADAITTGRRYNQFSLLKYDGSGQAWRFGDVIELVHPKPVNDQQSKLFQFALDRRRHKVDVPPDLDIVFEALAAESMREDRRRDFLRNVGLPRGFTWERLAGWLPGGMDAEAWCAVIPEMGVMALLRNLNNFDRAGIGPKAMDMVRQRISDPVAIADSGVFPYRFLTAYANAETDNYKLAISQGADASAENLPRFKGSVIVMVDCSGSMMNPVGTGRSSNPLSLSFLAGFMAETLSRRFDSAVIVTYDDRIQNVIQPRPHVPAVKAGAEPIYRPRGGTRTWTCARAILEKAQADRMIIITDEQAHDGDQGVIKIPVITWNLAGYNRHQADHGQHNRHLISGVSDNAIKVLPSVITRSTGRWPWEM